MGNAAIAVVQVISLVLVIVAIVYARRALRDLRRASGNMDRTVAETRRIRRDIEKKCEEIETRFETKAKEMDDAIAALRRLDKKKKA